MSVHVLVHSYTKSRGKEIAESGSAILVVQPMSDLNCQFPRNAVIRNIVEKLP